MTRQALPFRTLDPETADQDGAFIKSTVSNTAEAEVKSVLASDGARPEQRLLSQRNCYQFLHLGIEHTLQLVEAIYAMAENDDFGTGSQQRGQFAHWDSTHRKWRVELNLAGAGE